VNPKWLPFAKIQAPAWSTAQKLQARFLIEIKKNRNTSTHSKKIKTTLEQTIKKPPTQKKNFPN